MFLIINFDFLSGGNSSPKLWEFMRENNSNCISIPHHVSESVHPLDWSVSDEEIELVVELFQCRGNAEYRGAILEALRARRCFGTTGDQIFMNVNVNNAFMGETAKLT